MTRVAKQGHEFEALHAVADRNRRAFARTLIDALRELRGSTTIAELQAILADGRFDLVVSSIAFQSLLTPSGELAGAFAGLDARYASIIHAAARASAQFVETAGMEMVFDLTNPFAARAARDRAARLVVGVLDESREAIRQIIFTSIQRGIPAAEAARDIAQVVGLTRQQALAVDNYRRALLEGLESGADVRGAVQGRFSLSARVPRTLTGEAVDRLSRGYADRMLRHRAITIARTECLPGTARVDGARVTAIHRRWYEGEWIEVVTKTGRQFSGTPNHPVLTTRGWVGLGQLTERDHLICNRIDVEGAGTAGNLHVHDPPPTLNEIWDAAADVWVGERSPTLDVDFHGDGGQGDVDVLHTDGVLLVGDHLPVSQRSVEGVLPPSLVGLVVRCAFRSPFSRGDGVTDGVSLSDSPPPHSGLIEDAADEFVGCAVSVRERLRRVSSLVVADDGRGWEVRAFGGDLVAAGKQGFPGLAVGSGDASLSDDVPDGVDVTSSFVRDELGGHARQVEVDDVALLSRRYWRGHVYNLTTVDGYFSSNQVYTGNTIWASNRGQRELWEQMARRGLLDTQRTRIVWTTTPDSRSCEVCVPMDGQTIEFFGQFTSTEKGVAPADRVAWAGPTVPHPPIHSSCRCATRLEFDGE